MSGISLTASMRSNLLSLQNIASQQDIVQNRLATGLKVSSAIDNPSSYYTTSSLNNRAADLTALLDAMSQGIQTIKAASEAIDSGTKFLEQAKAIANQALETAIPAKEWFAEQVGENGAVVETTQELLDAVNAGKETIVVYGKINMENQNIVLKKGQKLVGTEYFTNIASRNKDGSRFSQLHIVSEKNRGGVTALGNNLIASLDITYTNYTNLIGGTIDIQGKENILRDVDLAMLGTENGGSLRGAIINSGEVILHGEIKLTTLGGNNVNGIGNYQGHTVVAADARIDIDLKGNTGTGIVNYIDSVLDIYGRISVDCANNTYGALYNNSGTYAGNQIHIYNGAEIFERGSSYWALNFDNNRIIIEQGVKIALEPKNDGIINYYIYAGAQEISSQTIITLSYIQNHSHDFLPSDAFDAVEKDFPSDANDLKNNYCLLLCQYSLLLTDASYKGVNLLTGQNLKINFNEDRSSKIDVTGVKADSDSLGLKTKEWKTVDDIEKSISELEEAINSLRGFASQFGNYYSIITTRQDFTENLINVLEEGADKLTLADMNQESANMLALQTSQQLAVNSLSLASQASQSILRLF